MNSEAELQGAQKVVEIAEKLESLTRKDGWKEYQHLIDQLLEQEIQALVGVELNNDYYKRIGFLQMLNYIKEIPTVVKDKKIREYLLHQGRVKALTVAKGGLIAHYRKQKTIAMQKIKSILGAPTPLKEHQGKVEHAESVYKEQG